MVSFVFRKTKRARRDTNTRKRKRMKLQQWMRKRRRRKNPGPRKQKWTSWRTSWVEEQDRLKEMTVIMRNYKSSCFIRKWSRRTAVKHVVVTCTCIKQHLQAIRNTQGYWRHPGKIPKDSGTCVFLLIDFPICTTAVTSIPTCKKWRGDPHVLLWEVTLKFDDRCSHKLALCTLTWFHMLA